MPHARQPRRLSALIALFTVALAAFIIPATADVSPHDVDAMPVPRPVEAECHLGSLPRSGTQDVVVRVDGRERTYALHIPSTIDHHTPAATVVAFHGLGGSGSSMLDLIDAAGLAHSTGTVVAAIDGTSEAFGRPGWALSGSDFEREAREVTAVIADIAERACLNPDQIFAMGYSNGSVFAQKLACRTDSPFAAVAGVAGPYLGDDCRQVPVPTVYFHGTSDTVVPLDGGTTVIGPLPSLADTLAARAAANECVSAEPRRVSKAGVHHQRWSACRGADVHSYVIEGAGHRWPGSAPSAQQGQGHSADIDATDLSWQFFTQVAKRTAGLPNDALDDSMWSVLWNRGD